MDTQTAKEFANSEMDPVRADAAEVRAFSGQIESLLDNVVRVVLGKRDVAVDCLIGMLSGEHVLLEDVPGVGKTLMGKALARSIDGRFRRIQFTPDLLPNDIVGSSIFNTVSNQFEFNAGPIFSNFVLADEINRAPPRTQSALLEAMSDNQVSVDGTTHDLPSPFMVIATQNPFEFEGTYLLPESQLDRFLFRISMGYPEREFEQQILTNHRAGEPVEGLQSVCNAGTLMEMKDVVRQIEVDSAISSYIMDVVHATRQSPSLSVGVSTRGALLWYRAAQSNAFIDGRAYVIPDDASDLAIKVLAHRVKPTGKMGLLNRDEVESIMRELVGSVPMPE